MRLVQTRVPAESRRDVLDTLEEENIEHIAADERGDSDGMILYFPLPDGAVEKVMNRLHDDGLEDDAFTVISDIQSATTPTFDELESQYTQGPDEEVGLSHATLRANAREVTPGRLTFVVFSALAAIVAVSGLLLNSAIVIVGAMVISPFAGSSLSASVGFVIGDYQSLLDSFKSQLLGLVVAIVSATAAAAVFRYSHLVPATLAVGNITQVSAFSIPIVLTFVIAIFAGAAGALALATDLDVSLAGVAVAGAIIPAASAVGIAVIWRDPVLVVGAFVLLTMNLLLINVSAYVALTLFGYRASTSPRHVLDYAHFDVRTAAYAVVGVVAVVLLVAAVVSAYQYFVFVETVNQDIDDVFGQSQYSALEVIDTQTDYGAVFLPTVSDSNTISVTVGRSSNEDYSKLSRRLQRHIAGDVSRRITVEVQFVDYQRAKPASNRDRSSFAHPPNVGLTR